MALEVLLVLDDSKGKPEEIAGVVKSHQPDVHICLTAAAALEYLAKDHHPSVILVDLKLPDMDGAELIKSIRDRGLKTPIVVLTTQSDDVAKAYELPVNLFITKEKFTPEKFKEVVEKLKL